MSNPATNWEDVCRVQTARIAELERENDAMRAELDWKTEQLKLVSDCLHNLDGLFGQGATDVFIDALDAARKGAQR